MLGTIASSFESGLKIKYKLDELKKIKYSEEKNNISGNHQVVYIYTDDKTRKLHVEEMIKNGWVRVDAQNIIHIYFNFFDDKKIDAICEIYEKRIKSILD